MPSGSLCCRSLTYTYPGEKEPVLQGLDLAVAPGEVVLLMGPSGCGKSTLAYCLAGLYPEYGGQLTGEILADGQNIAGLSPQARAGLVSILFQNPDNQFCMSRVDHEILFALENIHYTGDMGARVAQLLALAGLEGLEEHPLHTLSGGTKQKVALATSLATGAKVLLLDEPFANIDPESCVQLAGRLRALNEAGLTLLVVDHRLDYWRDFLTRVVLMDRDGSLTADIPAPRLEEHRDDFRERGLFFGDDWLAAHRPPPLPAKGEPAIEAGGLSVAYGRHTVLCGLDFEAQQGTLTALVGSNGSGKSTLLSALAGLVRHSGHLWTAGPVGLVFQNPRYQFLTLKVEEEVLFTLRREHPGKSREELREEAHRLLEEFGLLPWAGSSPYALSQGQQRRLAILSMLAGERPVLLLDEPTYAQDQRATLFIMELLRQRIERGLTAVMATHDHALARTVAHRVLCLEEGVLHEV